MRSCIPFVITRFNARLLGLLATLSESGAADSQRGYLFGRDTR